MRQKRKDVILIIILIAVIFAILIYSGTTDSVKIISSEKEKVTFNQRERALIREKRQSRCGLTNVCPILIQGFWRTI